MYSKCIQHIVLCSAAIRSVAMMAALWKKPVVTWTPIKEDSDSFPTLIATLGSYEDIARNIATLLQCQGWKTIGNPSHNVYMGQTDAANHSIPETPYISLYTAILNFFKSCFLIWVTQTIHLIKQPVTDNKRE